MSPITDLQHALSRALAEINDPEIRARVRDLIEMCVAKSEVET